MKLAPTWSGQNSTAAAIHSIKDGPSLDEVFASVPASTAHTQGQQAITQRLADLQRNIDARMERNKRLSEGGAVLEDVAGIRAGTTEAPGLSSAAVSPATPAPGALLTELEREKEVTAFLERAVMSC